MSTRNLVEISLSGLDDEATQAVASLFDRWGRGGAVIEQILDGETGADTRSTVKTYLLAEDDDALCQIEIGLALLKQARHVFPSQDFVPPEDFAPCGDFAPLPEPRMRFLAETDWAEAWKASYDVLPVGRRLVVKPTWRDYTLQPEDLVVELDPGMAFGSGLHPTTRLCLEAMEDRVRPGATLLDVGTGSGILAIAAARLGASRVLALDTDPLAVRIARENVALNGVESVVRVEVGTVQIANQQISKSANQQIGKSANRQISKSANQQISKSANQQISKSANHRFPIPNTQYPLWDLVVANILAEVIIELAPALAVSLAPGGTLIASGIIADRANAVVAGLRGNGLSFAERRDDGEWVALVAFK